MPLVAPTVWTNRRKWIGNLIPILFWLPPTAAGLAWMAVRSEILGPGLVLVAAGCLLGWLALNQFGLFENGRMRRQLERILRDRGLELPQDRNFVGFASPKYSGMLDAHEDVGFLVLRPESVRFISETRQIELLRSQLIKVRQRANVHTLVGLGGWISIEGLEEGKPIRMLIEPRDRKTLLGNLRRRKALLAKIRRWISSGVAAPPADPRPAAKS